MTTEVNLDAGRLASRRTARATLDSLAEALGAGVQRDVPLAPFTAMRVGGPADLLVVVDSSEELAEVVTAARRYGIPWRVLGGGCNVLIADQGIRGVVVINRAASVSFDHLTVHADSGAKLASLARRTIECSLAGMAWATGLPGTVGGAVVGNAGAFDGDIASTLQSATVLEPDGQIVEREHAWFGFEYRGSRLRRESDKGRVVLEASFELEPGDETKLKARGDEILEWRRERHPSGPTMGSTFKNPPGHYAGELIEQVGLKGYRVGGARVSEQHANFLINVGDATAGDVMALIRHVQAEVERRFGLELALEVELLGW